jgi:hypothetical protein
MSVFDKLWGFKRQYDEMDPYRRSQLNIAVIGVIVLLAALWVMAGSFSTLKNLFKKP